MVSSRVKCQVCGKEKITRHNRFRCCKLLQDVKKCIIADGVEIKKRKMENNVQFQNAKNSEKNAKNSEKMPIFSLNSLNIEELKGVELENE